MRTETPIHPGVTLKEDFLEPMGLSARALAKHLGVPTNRITRVVNGQTTITADTALRLEKAFGVSAEFWLDLQTHYELIRAKAGAVGLDAIPNIRAA